MKKQILFISIFLLFFASCGSIKNISRKKVIYTVKYTKFQKDKKVIPTEILRKRFENFGLYKSKFTYLNDRLIIELRLKKMSDTADISQLIIRSGKLEFLEVEKQADYVDLHSEFQAIARKYLIKPKNFNIKPNTAFGICSKKDIPLIKNLLLSKKIQSKLPKNSKFLFTKGRKGESEILLVKNKGIYGNIVQKAKYEKNQYGQDILFINLKSEYREKWAQMTKKNIDKNIAVVFDDIIFSYPRVMDEIKGGVLTITGIYDKNEAKLIGNILNSEIINGKFVIEKITND